MKDEKELRAPEIDGDFWEKLIVGQKWQTTTIKANIKHLLDVAKRNGNTKLTLMQDKGSGYWALPA